jgi:hypothetical protein
MHRTFTEIFGGKIRQLGGSKIQKKAAIEAEQ